jgi:hypothetical protein
VEARSLTAEPMCLRPRARPCGRFERRSSPLAGGFGNVTPGKKIFENVHAKALHYGAI